MTLCNIERASSVRRPRRPRMTPQLCHCTPASQIVFSSAEFCLRGPLHPRLRGSQTHSCPASRRGNAAGRHLNATARVGSVHTLKDAADAVPQLLQHDGRGASSCPPTRLLGLLKGLLDTVLQKFGAPARERDCCSERPSAPGSDVWLGVDLVAVECNKELPSETESTVWAAVEPVAMDASRVMF